MQTYFGVLEAVADKKFRAIGRRFQRNEDGGGARDLIRPSEAVTSQPRPTKSFQRIRPGTPPPPGGAPREPTGGHPAGRLTGCRALPAVVSAISWRETGTTGAAVAERRNCYTARAPLRYGINMA